MPVYTPIHPKPAAAAGASVLPAALQAVAADAVSAALAAEFIHDELLAPAVSRAVSVINSVVKRSGHVIERVVAETLENHGLIIYRSVAMGVTAAAENVVSANNPAVLKTVRIKADAEVKHTVFIDLLVIDTRRGTAMIYELKRGNGETEKRKRLPIERNLRCCTLQLQSFVRQLGYQVDEVGCGVIDYFGSSGFDPSLTITRDTLDEHFQVPLRSAIEAATAIMSDALAVALPGLLAGTVATPTGSATGSEAALEASDDDAGMATSLAVIADAPTLIIDAGYLDALDLDAMPLARVAARAPAATVQAIAPSKIIDKARAKRRARIAH
jgi:hypothetical protein